MIEQEFNKRRLHSEINVVPYIDVMLVLLIIFMILSPLLIQGVDVDLPQTRSITFDNNLNFGICIKN